MDILLVNTANNNILDKIESHVIDGLKIEFIKNMNGKSLRFIADIVNRISFMEQGIPYEGYSILLRNVMQKSP